MRIGIIGINHKQGSLKLRESLAKACQRHFLSGCLSYENHTSILLSTCNRTEIYFSSNDLASTHSYLLQLLHSELEEDFDQKVYSYFGHECFLHLARVTAGLDSAIVAETEIQGQVKIAYERASSAIGLPADLHYLFQKALKIGKKVRSELPLGRGLPDLEHAILNTGLHFFTENTQPNILFVGASEVNCKILTFLKQKKFEKVTICNRSIQRSQEIADNLQINLLKWEQLPQWYHYDWVIFGTKSPQYLISRQDLSLRREITPKLLMDLSVPRNVEPKIGKESHITLLNIDQINRILNIRQKKMAHSLAQAEQLVSRSAFLYVDNYRLRLKKSVVA